MIIARFGSTYAGAYVFPTSLMIDQWSGMRPQVVHQVGGAGGVYDVYGQNNSPPTPFVVSKKFSLAAASSSAIDDARDTLKDATLAEDLTYLWALDRDGSTTYRVWAKCQKFTASESYQEKGRWLKKVSLEFFCREGLWLGPTTQTFQDLAIPAGVDNHVLANDGNYPAMVYFKITANGAAATSSIMTNSTVSPSITATYTGSVAAGDALEMNSATYAILNNGADGYADFAMSGDDRAAWMWLQPGNNTIQTNVTGAGLVSYDFDAIWEDTYVIV